MTADRITANLPSRDFDVTEAFYATLGFRRQYRDDGWMILDRNGMSVEFFAHPELDPRESWHSACLRRADIDTLHAEWLAVGIATEGAALPRIGAETLDLGDGAPRMFTLLDPDGSLWRILEDGEGG
ncbi:bleomycin resistance protein [Roseovarius spongiae]|uniref:Bleomycin resistance protein n=1 Tax=Roseovarius spongiae TaxID=2320272 RepID=A0A3A8AW43_9RHOB|nr:bleomycin resistance protein [Roseovarius spongiae]RKF16558.1 bleomycin resistance protein [Roseovarius spongiae]